MQIYVQFEDPSEEFVIAEFGCEQDPEVYPNQGVIDADDPRYLDFLARHPKAPI